MTFCTNLLLGLLCHFNRAKLTNVPQILKNTQLLFSFMFNEIYQELLLLRTWERTKCNPAMVRLYQRQFSKRAVRKKHPYYQQYTQRTSCSDWGKVILTVLTTPEESCCSRLLLELCEAKAEGRLEEDLKLEVPRGDPIEVMEDLLESNPPKEPMEQDEGRRLLTLEPLPGVRSIGTLRLLLAIAALCESNNRVRKNSI